MPDTAPQEQQTEPTLDALLAEETDPYFVLDFAAAAIRDAISLEDGLDAGAGSAVLHMIEASKAARFSPRPVSFPPASDLAAARERLAEVQRLRAQILRDLCLASPTADPLTVHPYELIRVLDKHLLTASLGDGDDSARDATVTRFEVIDHRSVGMDGLSQVGRCFSAWDCAVELSRQDNGRTLKVFVFDPDAARTAPGGASND